METEKQGDENPSSEGKEDGEGETPVIDDVVEGETPIVDSIVEGETPVVEEVTEGETPMETGDETRTDFRGATPVPMEEGATPSDVRGENPIYIEGATPMVDNEGETPEKLKEETDLHVTGVPEPAEIFMDDFTVYGNSFDTCLASLDLVLKRCQEKHFSIEFRKMPLHGDGRHCPGSRGF